MYGFYAVLHYRLHDMEDVLFQATRIRLANEQPESGLSFTVDGNGCGVIREEICIRLACAICFGCPFFNYCYFLYRVGCYCV